MQTKIPRAPLVSKTALTPTRYSQPLSPLSHSVSAFVKLIRRRKRRGGEGGGGVKEEDFICAQRYYDTRCQRRKEEEEEEEGPRTPVFNPCTLRTPVLNPCTACV